MTSATKPVTILIMLSQLMNTYHKNYLYVSQDKMLALLDKYHDYRIKRRMLNYRLAELEKAGMIRRQQRNKKNVNGTITPMTTLIFLTNKARRLLGRTLNRVARALGPQFRKAFHLDVQSQDAPAHTPLSRENGKEKARELLRTLA